MNPLPFLLAYLLLVAPCDDEALGLTAGESDWAPVFAWVAMEQEWLDTRECRYLLARPESFGEDVALLRRRARDLRHAPPLSDARRLPNRELVNELLAFNRSYRYHLESRQASELHHWSDWQEAIQETEQLYQVWDTVRDANCEYYYVTVRREALQRLRELIGEEAYQATTLPPYVPLWRFQLIEVHP